MYNLFWIMQYPQWSEWRNLFRATGMSQANVNFDVFKETKVTGGI